MTRSRSRYYSCCTIWSYLSLKAINHDTVKEKLRWNYKGSLWQSYFKVIFIISAVCFIYNVSKCHAYYRLTCKLCASYSAVLKHIFFRAQISLTKVFFLNHEVVIKTAYYDIDFEYRNLHFSKCSYDWWFKCTELWFQHSL